MRKFTGKFICFILFLSVIFIGCSKNDETIIIYSCTEDYKNEFYLAELQKSFPEINFVFSNVAPFLPLAQFLMVSRGIYSLLEKSS